jgi:hypothetical protein
MASVHVVPAEKKGKFKVLVNFVQEGVPYASKAIAETQANIIRTKFGLPTNTHQS